MSKTIEDIPFCDEFRPTAKEFEDFEKYLEHAVATAKSGIFKVIPPKNWKARADNYKNMDFTIPHPIEQIISGKDGFYELVYIQRESRLLSKYHKYVESFDKTTEGKSPLEMEKKFWKTLKFSSPLYGADAPGSIFDKGVPWNLSEIDSVLKKGLNGDIQGVTTPYLYVGSWKSMFAWHKEDLDLYSINYLHFGRPKCWYGIRAEEHKKFEAFAAKHFPEAAKDCSEFLRHKTYLIHPQILINNGFTIHKCIQSPGEFVVTKCAGFHAGFNMGFNCAEAVNFALKNWIDYGKKAKYCKCLKDAVKIEMTQFEDNVRRNSNSNEKSPLILIGKKTNRSPGSSIVSRSKSRSKSIPRENPKGGEVIDNWLRCDECDKWRKIPRGKSLSSYKNGFKCDLIKNSSCKNKEVNWKKTYTTINKKITGAPLRANRKNIK